MYSEVHAIRRFNLISVALAHAVSFSHMFWLLRQQTLLLLLSILFFLLCVRSRAMPSNTNCSQFSYRVGLSVASPLLSLSLSVPLTHSYV